MSKKQWMALLMLFLIYLLLGASIFYHIESEKEMEAVEKARQERKQISALLESHYVPKTEVKQHEIFEKLTKYCGKKVHDYGENETDPLKWDFYNSFFFAYTVVSTIGYGNLAPTDTLSRILMIFYALLGIPMNGILLSQLGEFFSTVFIRAHKKYKSYKEYHQDEYTKKLAPLETRKAGLFARVLMYLIPGFVMFIFFPAFVFSYFENDWSYDKSVYYAFVTLTTIGFGDAVAGYETQGSGVLLIIYKVFLIVWIVFGLGYIVMIMTFITRGMRSKKIVRLERKLAMNLKQTQNKIWSEFNKEVGYLRRVFNELQLSKVKRIYVDEYDYEVPTCKSQRSNSFPDLRDLVYGGLSAPEPPHPRRRANSEVVPVETPVARVVSETDLQRIDKTATFATHAMVQPAELLARLVNILGYIPPPPDDDEQTPEADVLAGVQGFSDKDILSNERSNNWKIGADRLPFGKPRSRAASEVRLDPKFDPNMLRNQEWTWSGPAASRKIQEIIKARRNANKDSRESKSIFPALNLPKSVPLPKWIKQLSNKKEGRSRSSMSVGDLGSTDDNYLSQINNFNEGSTYFTHTGANLPSSLEGSNLLEETSLADFLRALTALHTRVGAVPDEYVKKPQRKMGTASLTPPKLPSLLALFSPLGGPSASENNPNSVTDEINAGRRFSLRGVENPGATTSNYVRRSSMIPTGKPRNRRFSLRPVVTPLGNTPQASPHLSALSRKDRQVQPQAYNTELHFESPKEPLVSGESAPGVSSPVATITRRFSLRPTQMDSTTTSSITKNMPRWRAGMLQRQINQINLQKRVRAFSLSDVNTDGMRSTERNLGVSPLVSDVAVRTFGSKDPNKNPKTVTILSPSSDDRSKTLSEGKQGTSTFIPTQRPRVPFLRTISASNNPFSSTDSKQFNTNPFIDIQRQKISTLPDDKKSLNNDEEQTIFEALKDVKHISTVPTMRQGSESIPLENEKVHETDSSPSCARTELPQSEKSADSQEASQELSSKESIDKSRKVSAVSISHWVDSKKPSSGKLPSNKEQGSSSESSAAQSRKSSSVKSPTDKPRVSIDSYKPLLEIRIDKPTENPFERYHRVSMQHNDEDPLKEVKVDESGASTSSAVRKISMGLEKGSRESTT